MKKLYIIIAMSLILLLLFVGISYAHDYKSLILSSDLLPEDYDTFEYEITVQCLELDKDISEDIKKKVAHKKNYSHAINLLRINISYLDSDETRGQLSTYLAETVHKLQVYNVQYGSEYTYIDVLYELAPYLSSSQIIDKDADLGGITTKELIKKAGAKPSPTYTPEQIERYSNILAFILGVIILIGITKWNIRCDK